MILPELDQAKVTALIEDFIRAEMADAGLGRVVVGVSGGLDSSVALVLCARALGPENVTALSLPAAPTSAGACADAESLANGLGVSFATIDIAPQLDVYFERFGDADPLRRGNKAARERMAVLYDHAKMVGALVCGTSNKSEVLLGYGTVFGDTACAFNPLGDLYKTELRRLGPDLGVPQTICARPPSAELWDGQTDESELGYTYDELDLLLWALVDRGMDDGELLEGGFTPAMIRVVRDRMAANAFKRRMPRVCSIH